MHCLVQVRVSILAGLALAASLGAGCTHPSVTTVESFRASRRAGDLEKARGFLGDDPRVWYDRKEGEGSPWKLGAGRWKAWDTHFRGKSDLGPWHVEGETVWAIAEEMNDYFRLIERTDTPRYRITYFMEPDGRLGGYMISAADPQEAPDNSPDAPPDDAPVDSSDGASDAAPLDPVQRTDRGDEFAAWAKANAPEEWAYLRPGGSLDPTGDRAPRTRILANRWRASEGLPPIKFK